MPSALLECQPIERKMSETVVKLIKDDLTALPVDAFVFYAREDLQLGSGYGTAIQQRGGASIKKELEGIGRVGMGEAVVTSAGQMRARFIIHACGPKFGEPDLEQKLRNCIRSALLAAAEAGVRTLAFPPMGVGFYGVPMELSIRVMLECFRRHVEAGAPFAEILICAVDRRDFDAISGLLAAYA
jgi:O-acetyl-ADP-ribose deacetylase (regulator of RNase III)